MLTRKTTTGKRLVELLRRGENPEQSRDFYRDASRDDIKQEEDNNIDDEEEERRS